MDELGYIDIESIKNLVDENTEIVSIAYVHNELGIIQDVKHEKLLRKRIRNVFFIFDSTGFWESRYCSKSQIDILTLSGRKSINSKEDWKQSM